MIKSAFAICAALLTLMPAALAGDALSPAELKALAPGRYAVNVMGLVNMTVSMRPNGVITGQADGDKDRGSWSIHGQKLCISWSKWNSGKTSCASLSGNGGQYRGGGLSIQRI
jgi:hypothetical protein